jgi:hypothetical protein
LLDLCALFHENFLRQHTAYSKLHEAEVPEQVIMALMGHVSRTMRERYSHARMDAMR